MFIALDDTDSTKGMCTTYLTTLILRKFKEMNLKADMPNLIRLDPNIPYKTRGNGACYFHIDGEGKEEDIKKIVLNFIEKYAMFDDENTNPACIFLEDENFSKNFEILNKFYKKAVSELCTIDEADEIIKKINAEVLKFKNGRGIIGCLGALGCDFSDVTFELLVYRKEENFGKKRMIDEESVFNMNKLLYPETFDNVNEEEHKVVFMPHGNDPVLCGIRGNNVEVVEKAFSMVKFKEEISFFQIFRTNQHTDAHLKFKNISELKQYDAGIIEGYVVENPKRIKKGHTFFKVSDGTGTITCAAYGVTKLKDVAINLIKGDKVRVYGGIESYKDTFNIEKIEILELAKIYKKENPLCPNCGIKMKSEGKGKGFQCKKCKLKIMNEAKFVEIKRNIETKIYEVEPGRRRHLSKPLCRYKN